MITFYVLQKTIGIDKGGINSSSFMHANELYKLNLGNVYLVHIEPTQIKKQDLEFNLHAEKGLMEGVGVLQPDQFLSKSDQANWLLSLIKNDLKRNEKVFIINEDKSLFQMVVLYKHIFTNLKLIQVIHNNHMDLHGGVKEQYQYMFDRQNEVDKFIVLTKQQKFDLIDTQLIRPEKTVCLPNAISENVFIRKEVNLRKEINIFTRYNDRQKGITKFLTQIMPPVIAQVPNVHVNFYGALNKPEESSVAQPFIKIVNENKLYNNVTINDYVNGEIKRNLMSRTLFTVLSSNYEGMPLTILEMAQYGVPTIAFDVKYGPREWINNNENGYLVDNGDVDLFVKRMIYLLTNPELTHKLGIQAQATVKNKYQDTKVMLIWSELIAKLVDINFK